MSFSDCQRRPLWVCSTCPLSLQPCWNHSPLTLVLKKNQSGEQSHAILGGVGELRGFHLRLYLGKAAKRAHFLPNAHQTQMQQFELGELWIWAWNSMSKWISFIWLHSIWNPGLEPAWQSYRAPRVRLNSLCCELAVSAHSLSWGSV